MDDPEKLSTQDEEQRNKDTTQYLDNTMLKQTQIT